MEAKHIVKNTLSNDAFLSVNKAIMRDLKDANATIVLSLLIDKHNYFEKEKMLEGDSFFNTKAMLEADSGLSEKKIKSAEDRLEKLGYISTKVKGIGKSRRKWYTLHWERILRSINSIGHATYRMSATQSTKCMTNDTQHNNTQGNNPQYNENKMGDVGEPRRTLGTWETSQMEKMEQMKMEYYG